MNYNEHAHVPSMINEWTTNGQPQLYREIDIHFTKSVDKYPLCVDQIWCDYVIR